MYKGRRLYINGLFSGRVVSFEQDDDPWAWIRLRIETEQGARFKWTTAPILTLCNEIDLRVDDHLSLGFCWEEARGPLTVKLGLT